jgi:hypothetical protein
MGLLQRIFERFDSGHVAGSRELQAKSAAVDGWLDAEFLMHEGLNVQHLRLLGAG